MVGEACLPSNAYYPRTPDYTLYSGVHVCWSEHSDSSFVYGFMSLDYGLGTMTASILVIKFSVYFNRYVFVMLTYMFEFQQTIPQATMSLSGHRATAILLTAVQGGTKTYDVQQGKRTFSHMRIVQVQRAHPCSLIWTFSVRQHITEYAHIL